MWPAGLNQSFGGFCGATFVIGSGLGTLETAANPYLTGMSLFYVLFFLYISPPLDIATSDDRNILTIIQSAVHPATPKSASTSPKPSTPSAQSSVPSSAPTPSSPRHPITSPPYSACSGCTSPSASSSSVSQPSSSSRVFPKSQTRIWRSRFLRPMSMSRISRFGNSGSCSMLPWLSLPIPVLKVCLFASAEVLGVYPE